MNCKIVVAIGLMVIGLTGCKANEDHGLPITKSVDRNDMPNPASLYCVELKGKIILKQSSSGARGDCYLPDGKIMDEWVLYRRDHTAHN